eukprot:m.34614 g.34614  ORF g.34614 m.34614 type:complete len:1251 (+) comp9938_c0_seq2:76-3828(+)
MKLIIMLLAVGVVVMLLTITATSVAGQLNEFNKAQTDGLQFNVSLYSTLEFMSFPSSQQTAQDALLNFQLVSIGGVDFLKSFQPPFVLTGVQVHTLGFWKGCIIDDGNMDLRVAYHTSGNLGNNRVLVVGGVTFSNDSFHLLPHNYILSVEEDSISGDYYCQWARHEAENTPIPRFGHSMVPHPYTKGFFVHGGCDEVGGRVREVVFLSFISCKHQTSDLHYYSPSANRWEAIELQSSLPPLSFHQLGFHDSNILYMFAGWTNSASIHQNRKMFFVELPTTFKNYNSTISFPLIAGIVDGYIHDTSRSRGQIDVHESRYILYFFTSLQQPNRQLEVWKGTITKTANASYLHSWSNLDRVSRFHYPGSSIELSNSFFLGGGFAFRSSKDGFGVLSGVLINSALGTPAPNWITAVAAGDESIAINGFVIRTQPGARTFAQVAKLSENEFLVTGGLNSGPRNSNFVFKMVDPSFPSGTPVVHITTNLPEISLARGAHCLVPIDDNQILVAGGVVDFVASPRLTDAIYFKDTRDAQSIERHGYNSLPIQGQTCFNLDGFVFSVGGRNVGAARNMASVTSDGNLAFASIWNNQTGWSECAVRGYHFSLSFGSAAVLVVPNTSPPRKVVLYYGGYNSAAEFPTPLDSLLMVSCEVPWAECRCADLRVQEIEKNPNLMWPPAKISSCMVPMGLHQLVLNGGHFDGTPQPEVFTLTLRSDSSIVWEKMLGENGFPVTHPTKGFGYACFSYKRHMVTLGGTSRGHIFNDIHLMKPTCNLGHGVLEGNFLNSTCEPCPINSYRNSFFDDTCVLCGDGVQRAVGSIGDTQQSCTTCVGGYCGFGADRCEVSREFKAICICSYFYDGMFCDRLKTTLVVRVVAIPLALIALVLLIYLWYRRYSLLRQKELVHKQLVDETTAELHELHSSWEISVDDVDFIKQIGAGGFGSVWLAKWLVIDQEVAVKKLQLGVWNNVDKDLFLAEINFMKSIKHRNIVYFHGANLDGGDPFIVMEYAARGSLANVIQDTEVIITASLRLSFMKDAADGMDYLHTLSPPRVHGDLKSFNLLVTSSWVVKVADFTTSRRATSHLKKDEANTKKNTPVVLTAMNNATFTSHKNYNLVAKTSTQGTLQWCAPEVLRSDVRTLSVDVYSFGIVMWEVLERDLPFKEYGFSAPLVNAIVEEDKRPEVSSENELVFPTYVSLMRECWDPLPRQRPSFLEVKLRLGQCRTYGGDESGHALADEEDSDGDQSTDELLGNTSV